ncbi:MAG: sigma factor-like helix-turn-helix DNA-binding protein [Solirubrobacteraceae bacterium]
MSRRGHRSAGEGGERLGGDVRLLRGDPAECTNARVENSARAFIRFCGDTSGVDTWPRVRAGADRRADRPGARRFWHFEGLTHEQIAARLGIPQGTVKSRSYRAHRRLASALGHLRRP